MSALPIGVVMEERFAPSRAHRLGTRRRAPRQAAQSSASGVSRSAERRAPSLDTVKQLATTETNIREMTVHEWMKALETPQDTYRQKLRLHRQLCDTVFHIWQGHARKAKSLPEGKERDAEGVLAGKWEKEHLRLQNCQAEWIGYRAECCKGYTRPVAVPIGCNHRLCPLCAWHRAENARKRVRRMFDRLTHPVLITLTIPNLRSIRKHDYTLFRQKVRQLLKQRGEWIKGGVYSLETTYNRSEKTWHIHVHILADVATPLPTKQERTDLFGRNVYAFTAWKLALEYDWLRLWSKDWGKKLRKDANAQRKAGESYTFQTWVEATRANQTKEFVAGARKYVTRTDLHPVELARREQWNRENRRVIDLKPVTDRDGAAFEVLKYITKVAAFSDLPEAVEPFMNAVRGARLIQTFGTWYGVQLDGDANEHDWSELQCSCGVNAWQRMGVFHRHEVRMDADGRWRIREEIPWDAGGTVVKPKIPCLQGNGCSENNTEEITRYDDADAGLENWKAGHGGAQGTEVRNLRLW